MLNISFQQIHFSTMIKGIKERVFVWSKDLKGMSIYLSSIKGTTVSCLFKLFKLSETEIVMIGISVLSKIITLPILPVVVHSCTFVATQPPSFWKSLIFPIALPLNILNCILITEERHFFGGLPKVITQKNPAFLLNMTKLEKEKENRTPLLSNLMMN